MRLRLLTQVFDAETGLFQNWHREYNARLGRYIQSDPIGLAGGINTFAYVGGNPLSAIDPTGLASSPPAGCFKAKWGPGGYIYGWEPCDPPEPTPSPDCPPDGPPKPPAPPAPPKPPTPPKPPAPPKPPGQSGGPRASGPQRPPSCFWNCIGPTLGRSILIGLGGKGTLAWFEIGGSSLAASTLEVLNLPIVTTALGARSVYSSEGQCIRQCESAMDAGDQSHSYP